ncbi:hypothetical protein HAX54_033928 [Datura stramonium]|uniref:Uncharacterized protein n=1 Tax=Datura stramonium TaxID=4076 RepID=A0ABS8VFE6_DATST|nr:hypothetical protein [Datura stramonium]
MQLMDLSSLIPVNGSLIHRVTNGHDIVPHLPPYLSLLHKTYRHFPREVWLYDLGFGSLVYTVETTQFWEDPSAGR